MIKFLKSLFGSKEVPAEVPAEVPYKVEALEVVARPSEVSKQASEAVVSSLVPAKKTATKKPQTANKTPSVKKPRGPRKSK